MLTWTHATAADIDAYYDGRPRETMRAICIKLDGVPVAIIGLAKEATRDRAFSEYRPAMQPYLRSITVGRAIMAFVKWLHESRVPVYAISEGTGLLERIGFQQVSGEIYEWPN